MVYICTKFHENILNGIRVMERTRKINGRTDGRPDKLTDGQTGGRTDGGHDIIRPVSDGRIKCMLFATVLCLIPENFYGLL